MKTRIVSLSVVASALGILPSAYSQSPIPGGVTDVGLTYIVPDTPVWYNTNQLPGHPFKGYVTNGPIYNLDDQLTTKAVDNHGNWEPYASVMGDSTFLVGVSIYADDGSWYGSTNQISGAPDNQRYVLALQPATGGQPRIAEVFYDDFGQPYALHEMMRQRNPGVRVAGDKRYGAAHYVSGGSSALMYGRHWLGVDYFNQDGRLNTAWPLYGTGFPSDCNNACSGTPPGTSDTQWVFLQSFALNPTSLVSTPLDNAQEALYYPTWTNSVPIEVYNAANGLSPANQNVSYFGGDVVALSDGNYVVVADDYTGFWGGAANLNPAGGVAKIFRPDGSTVKDSWLVYARELWANVAAYKDGWATKISDQIFFFQNDGTPIATNTISAAVMGLGFDTGRGDGTRIGSDIRSHYVYIAGPVAVPTGGSGVGLGVWDGRTGAFITNAIVSDDLDPNAVGVDRVNLAVDALDRICVAYGGKPDKAIYSTFQMLARVMKFDGASVTNLTPTFFAFMGSDSTNNVQANGVVLNYISSNPEVAMTTKAICIATKGQLNSTNNPAGGPDMGLETDAYVVISHPAQVNPPQPVMTVTRSGNNVIISWGQDAGLFTLESSNSVTAPAFPWPAVSPQPAIVGPASGQYSMTVPIGTQDQFFRLAR